MTSSMRWEYEREKMTMTDKIDIEKILDNFMKKLDEENKKRVTTNRLHFPVPTAEQRKELKRASKEIRGNAESERKETKNNDNIISPNHYTSNKGFEVFDVQEAFIHELKGMSASYWCNIVKYILRFQKKNGVEDLKKAKYYLEKLIEEELKER